MEIGKWVGREIGRGLARLAVKKAGSRFLGHIAKNSREWRKAFEHIAEHFGPVPGKEVHAIFVAKFCSKEAVEALITKALSKPNRSPILSKLTIDGLPVGKPCVVIEREFTEVIGHQGAKELKILRIVVDFTGRPVTAFPVEKFVAGSAATPAGAAFGFLFGLTEVPTPVQDTYAAEAEERQKRIDGACEPDGWIEWVADFLLSPSCTTLEPHELISKSELEDRVQAAVGNIEAETGFQLDHETRDHVREDIRRIWGHLAPTVD
jgi:hypothetical protein